MNYQEFIDTIQTQLSQYFGSDTTLKIQRIAKNNGIYFDALIIIRPDFNISPTIYLTPYYHRYLDGVSMMDIYDDIIQSYHQHLPSHNFDTTNFTDFNKAQHSIVMRLVNYERNRDLLTQIPHKRYLDFAIIFFSLLHADEKEQAQIMIYNHHLNYWKVDADELLRLAQHNTPLLLPYHLENMADMLCSVSSDLPLQESAPLYPMYILSNIFRTNGAATILYKDLLKQISEQLNQDLIILPSSIHEILLIPTPPTDDLAAFHDMVKDVNETQLTDDEILSDHAYYYSKHDDVLSIRDCLPS